MKKNQSHYIDLNPGANDSYSVLYRLKNAIIYEKSDGELSIIPFEREMILNTYIIKPTLRSNLGDFDKVGYEKKD